MTPAAARCERQNSEPGTPNSEPERGIHPGGAEGTKVSFLDGLPRCEFLFDIIVQTGALQVLFCREISTDHENRIVAPAFSLERGVLGSESDPLPAAGKRLGA